MRKLRPESSSELLELKHLTKAPTIVLVIVEDPRLESKCFSQTMKLKWDKLAVPSDALKW